MNKLEQTTCKRCGRKLKNPTAIEIGMGAICWKKFQLENNHKKLWNEEDIKNGKGSVSSKISTKSI